MRTQWMAAALPWLALPCLALAATAVAATGNTLSGVWSIHSNIQGSESELQCTFTQKDKDLNAICKGDDPVTITGKVDDKKVTWQFKSVYEGQALTLVYSGKVEGAGLITGTVDVQPMEVSGVFEARKPK